MHSYMLQDDVVTVALSDRIVKDAATWGVPLEDPNAPPKRDCIELEHRVAQIVELIQGRWSLGSRCLRANWPWPTCMRLSTRHGG
jgi:hypothetical protein